MRGDPEILIRRSRNLFQAVVEPARPWIETATRVVVSPDGPLHALPFAALVSSPPSNPEPTWFIEWKPLHIAVSATVYAELRQQRKQPSSAAPLLDLVAFGNPVYRRTIATKTSAPRPTEFWNAFKDPSASVMVPATRKKRAAHKDVGPGSWLPGVGLGVALPAEVRRQSLRRVPGLEALGRRLKSEPWLVP